MKADRPRRPGIVVKLMLVSVVLLAIPWLAQRYFGEMRAFVIEGRRSALHLAAQAVATVLHDREDLFRVEGALPVPLQECPPLALEGPVQLDGNPRDWAQLDARSCRLARLDLREGDPPAVASHEGVDLALGQRGGHLYALFRVGDDAVRYRHPRHRNLDAADHIRIAVSDGEGRRRQYLVTAQRPGPISTYEVGDSWRYALGRGLPLREVRGTWAETPSGYNVELRLPLALLPDKKLGVAVADVDETAGRLAGLAGPGPARGVGDVEPVPLPAPGIVHILSALALPGARITIVDARGQVRSAVGEDVPPVEAGHRQRLLRSALDHELGRPFASPPFSDRSITAAAFPIFGGDRVMGAVLIEQRNPQILGAERDALERALIEIVLACALVAAILWLFAGRLAWRIRRLRDDAGAAIDPDGRVRCTELAAGRRAGDEIGDLSRSVSGLLARLARYTRFLEEIPRTLRHEIANPLNTLSISLQNLVAERPDLEDSKYVQSAERGVARIGEIVQGLTDAASLEDALRDDVPEAVDLARLVSRYVENYAAACPQRRFTLECPDEPLRVCGSDVRIEQMLDKLIDNAVAFSPPGGEIAVGLAAETGCARLAVGNDGPRIPEEMRERLFDSMVSTRGAGASQRPHLGIGLYVVRLIVEHLGGRIEVRDRDGGEGALFVVHLPLAPPGGP